MEFNHIRIRKTHPGLFRSYLMRGLWALIFGTALLFDNWSVYNIVGGCLLGVSGLMKMYGAFFEYQIAKVGLAIGFMVSTSLLITMGLGLRIQSANLIYLFWVQYAISQMIVMFEPPYNPYTEKK